jgi:hypothetical protein
MLSTLERCLRNKPMDYGGLGRIREDAWAAHGEVSPTMALILREAGALLGSNPSHTSTTLLI